MVFKVCAPALQIICMIILVMCCLQNVNLEAVKTVYKPVILVHGLFGKASYQEELENMVLLVRTLFILC